MPSNSSIPRMVTMVEFKTGRQSIHRRHSFAACGLAAIAIFAAGLSVCVPSESSVGSAPAAHTMKAKLTQEVAATGHDTDRIRQQLMALIVEQRRAEKLAGEFLRLAFTSHPLMRIYVWSAYPVGLLASRVDSPHTMTADCLLLPYAPLEWLEQTFVQKPMERVYSRREAQIVPGSEDFMRLLLSRKYIEIEMNLGVRQ